MLSLNHAHIPSALPSLLLSLPTDSMALKSHYYIESVREQIVGKGKEFVANLTCTKLCCDSPTPTGEGSVYGGGGRGEGVLLLLYQGGKKTHHGCIWLPLGKP